MQEQRTESARSKEETQDELIIRLLSLGGISIDDEGRVWRHGKRRGDWFYPYPEPRRIDHLGTVGYRDVKLTSASRKRVSTSAHRIQWVKHHGPVPDGLEINHKDRDKQNNRIGNLELTTHQENIIHAHSIKSWGYAGDQHYHAKLTWEKVRFIRAEVGSGRATRKAMADKFGVSANAISLIVSGKNWAPRHDPLNKADGS